jgi:hypothetical protein
VRGADNPTLCTRQFNLIVRGRRVKETLLASKLDESRSSEARNRAEASFKKEERAKEGAKAMMEYQANGRQVREQMARLKALRLAKEMADKAADKD